MSKDRARDPKRVINLDVFRVTKDVLGKGLRVEAKPDSPELTKHEDEAIALGNSGTERKGPKLIAGPGWMGENKNNDNN